MIDWLISNGFKPSWNEETNKAALTESSPKKSDDGLTREPVQQEPEIRQEEDTLPCKTHQVLMKSMFSKNKNKWYYSHKNELGQICFGSGYLEKK